MFRADEGDGAAYGHSEAERMMFLGWDSHYMRRYQEDEMKKKWMLGVTAALIAVSLTIPVCAGEWKREEAGWWYQHDDGSYPHNGWAWVDGKCYYFTPEGYCLTDTQTPDGYTVDASGAWVVDGVVQIQAPGPGVQAMQEEAAVQLDRLTVTVPHGFVRDDFSEEGLASFRHTGQNAGFMVASIHNPDAEKYQMLIDAMQETIVDQMAEEVLGEPVRKRVMQFPSGTWYSYDYEQLSLEGNPLPVQGTMRAYLRISGTKFQVVTFVGDLSGLDLDGIMNEHVR